MNAPVSPAATGFPVWKSVRLGVMPKAATFRDDFASHGVHLDPFAEYQLSRKFFPYSPIERDVDLVVVDADTLGLSGLVSYQRLCDRAMSFGLGRCPEEVGPALRLAYLEQMPRSGSLLIATDPMAMPNGSTGIFELEHYTIDRWVHPESQPPPGPALFMTSCVETISCFHNNRFAFEKVQN